jgi:hypothetical protein
MFRRLLRGFLGCFQKRGEHFPSERRKSTRRNRQAEATRCLPLSSIAGDSERRLDSQKKTQQPPRTSIVSLLFLGGTGAAKRDKKKGKRPFSRTE